jgi:RNA polymerase sigma-70 factor (ECF subfamily)
MMLDIALTLRPPLSKAMTGGLGATLNGSPSSSTQRMLYSPACVAFSHLKLVSRCSSVMPMNDEQTNLKRLAQMDPRAVTEVHDRHFAELFRYAHYRVSSPEVAEDIVSDVFVRLLEAAKRGKAPHSNLRGWLFSTCSNAINDHFRKRYKHAPRRLSDTLAADDPGPAKTLDVQEHLTHLNAALAQLTPDQQHVIALRFGAGYSLQETARLTGRQVNAVKALQFRAIQALRRLMDVER